MGNILDAESFNKGNVTIIELPCGVGKSTSLSVWANLVQKRMPNLEIIYISVPNLFLRSQMLQSLDEAGANWHSENGYGVIKVIIHPEMRKMEQEELNNTIVCVDELHSFFDAKHEIKTWCTFPKAMVALSASLGGTNGRSKIAC